MIAAALEDELETAKLLCRDPRKVEAGKIKLWESDYRGRHICFLRSGVGPQKAAENLQKALCAVQPSRILVIGYAGGLNPDLKIGDLVAVKKATAFSLDAVRPVWQQVRIEGEFSLASCDSLVQSALNAGLSACSGDILTSAYVLGNPAHKQLLYRQFKAAVVDMETAALARIAGAAAVPMSCIRAVSDTAQDDFLAPFSYDPSTGLPARTMKLLDTGMVGTYREWKSRANTAKQRLSRFLSEYFQSEM